MTTLEVLNRHIKSGSIHMVGNFFCDVEGETDKAVKIQYLGKLHWIPKSAFQAKKLEDNFYVFGIQQWMINKIMAKF